MEDVLSQGPEKGWHFVWAESAVVTTMCGRCSDRATIVVPKGHFLEHAAKARHGAFERAPICFS